MGIRFEWTLFLLNHLVYSLSHWFIFYISSIYISIPLFCFICWNSRCLPWKWMSYMMKWNLWAPLEYQRGEAEGGKGECNTEKKITVAALFSPSSSSSSSSSFFSSSHSPFIPQYSAFASFYPSFSLSINAVLILLLSSISFGISFVDHSRVSQVNHDHPLWTWREPLASFGSAGCSRPLSISERYFDSLHQSVDTSRSGLFRESAQQRLFPQNT